MRKPARSQWDFGELFPPEQMRKVWSVAELTNQVRRVLESQVGTVWVTGEVTNLRVQSSGHIYFTFKDASSQLSCVLFRSERVAHRELLQDGQRLLLQGDITVYEARGQYQLIVRAVELQGMGALQIAFEKLKQKLNAEGLFAQDRKRPLPKFPQRIGIVTSPTGAALRDVLHVARRRNPGIEFVLAPCRVQGDTAAREIAAAIRMLNDYSRSGVSRAHAGSRQARLDLVLVTRGGGSLEDLWAFNEEIVARAIFESALPVVSAVGHEIDFTISDFVADVRAATPSAAAEIITEDVFSSCEFVSNAARRIQFLSRRQIEDKAFELKAAAQRLTRVHPRRQLGEWLQLLDELGARLSRCAITGLRQHRIHIRTLADRLYRVRPAHHLKVRRETLSRSVELLREVARRRVEHKHGRVEMLQARLRLLGPDHVLSRGYSITLDHETGRVVRKAGDVRRGQRIKTRLRDGELLSRVESEDGSAA